MKAAYAVFACGQIESHLGLAETINRLHGVADRKQSAVVTGLPAGGQARQQGVLAAGGILKFVDQ